MDLPALLKTMTYMSWVIKVAAKMNQHAQRQGPLCPEILRIQHLSPVSRLISAYNSLTDKHLAGYFSNTRIRRHLQRAGLVPEPPRSLKRDQQIA